MTVAELHLVSPLDDDDAAFCALAEHVLRGAIAAFAPDQVIIVRIDRGSGATGSVSNANL